jgi:hypothetical protein
VKHIKCFEDFKVNNIQEEDIINCINSDGYIETDIVGDLPDNPDEPIRPISIDGEDILVDVDNQKKIVKLKNVKKIIYSE